MVYSSDFDWYFSEKIVEENYMISFIMKIKLVKIPSIKFTFTNLKRLDLIFFWHHLLTTYSTMCNLQWRLLFSDSIPYNIQHQEEVFYQHQPQYGPTSITPTSHPTLPVSLSSMSLALTRFFNNSNNEEYPSVPSF